MLSLIAASTTLKISDIKERCTPKAKKARIEPPAIIAEEVTDFETHNGRSENGNTYLNKRG